ncbi:MAG: hypothetical protein R3D59_02255 [Paracoccaceae bacterium]
MQGNTQNQTFAILRLQQFLAGAKQSRPAQDRSGYLGQIWQEPRRVIELDEVTYGYGNAAILGKSR